MKPSTLPANDTLPNDDALRPSIQSSICLADTTGTPRACADATIADQPSDVAESVCMFAVNTP